MTNRLINLIIKKATLKENRLLLTVGLALGIVLIVTFLKVYGSVLPLEGFQVQLLWLTSVNVTMALIILFSLSLLMPFKSFEFTFAVSKTRSLKEPQKLQGFEGDGPGIEPGELNMYQGAAPELTEIVGVQGKRLSLLSDFITSSAEVYDPKEFILSFIDAIKRVMHIELAAYLWQHDGGGLEGNIIASLGLDETALKSVESLLIKRTEDHVGDLLLKSSRRFGFINRDLVGGISACKSIDPEKFHIIELPLKCCGSTVGVLVLFFDMDKVTNFDLTLLDPILEYACVGFERLITVNSLHKQLLLSNKFAALGEMAAGVAHEVNNPLQIMIGNVDLLEKCLKEDEPGAEKVKEIKNGIFNIKSIVNNMLTSAREESMEIESVEVNSVREVQSPDPDLSLLLNKRVLMVEDEARIVDVVKPIITPLLAAFDTFSTISDAQAMLSSNDYDIILLDIGTPEIGSMKLYVWIKDQMPHLKENIIFLAAEVESEKMRGLLSITGIPAIKKPFGTKELLSVITSRLEEVSK